MEKRLQVTLPASLSATSPRPCSASTDADSPTPAQPAPVHRRPEQRPLATPWSRSPAAHPRPCGARGEARGAARADLDPSGCPRATWRPPPPPLARRGRREPARPGPARPRSAPPPLLPAPPGPREVDGDGIRPGRAPAPLKFRGAKNNAQLPPASLPPAGPALGGRAESSRRPLVPHPPRPPPEGHCHAPGALRLTHRPVSLLLPTPPQRREAAGGGERGGSAAAAAEEQRQGPARRGRHRALEPPRAHGQTRAAAAVAAAAAARRVGERRSGGAEGRGRRAAAANRSLPLAGSGLVKPGRAANRRRAAAIPREAIGRRLVSPPPTAWGRWAGPRAGWRAGKPLRGGAEGRGLGARGGAPVLRQM